MGRRAMRCAESKKQQAVEEALGAYTNLIHKEAWGCFKRVYNNSIYPKTTTRYITDIYSPDDLFQEGAILLIELILSEKYNPSRGEMSTLLVKSLRNRYRDIIKSTLRRTTDAVSLDDLSNAVTSKDHDSIIDTILVKELAGAMSNKALEVFACVSGCHKGFQKWMSRRDYARSVLKLRYKRRSLRELIAEFLERDVSAEFREIYKVVRVTI